MISHRRPLPSRPKIGLALAGGGQMGIIYEVGALRAIDEAFEGMDFTNIDTYVGVSAGAVVASCLANRMTTRAMGRFFIEGTEEGFDFKPSNFYTPAFGEYLRSMVAFPSLALETFCHYWGLHPKSSHPANQDRATNWVESIMGLARSMPTALFSNEPIHRSMRQVFKSPGCTNDFRALGQKLYVVAVDIDSGESVLFGDKGYDHVPISRAVEASSALPGLYPPVKIDNRYYVDGVLVKTMHASVALEAGADLVICLNPLVPYQPKEEHIKHNPSVAEMGLPVLFSQALRTIIRSRMASRMKDYTERYPNADMILFEPPSDDHSLFFANDFAFSHRHWVCEHAYQTTRRDLRRRSDELEPMLAKHGIRLRRDILADKNRTFDMSMTRRERP